MRLIFVTGVLLLASYASAQGGTDNCNQMQFLHCNNALGQYWHADMTTAWTNIDSLTSALDSQIRPPYIIQNYVNVCNGLGLFYSCLGQYNIRNCLGTLGFVGNGMTPTDAYIYEGYLAAWRFKCGGGFFMVYENDGLTNCTQSTHINYKDDMTGYIRNYVIATQNNPNAACDNAQTLMDQIGNIYATKSCRMVDSEKARIYGCQSIREYTNAQFSHCRHVTTCKKSTTPANLESFAEAEIQIPKEAQDWIKAAAQNI